MERHRYIALCGYVVDIREMKIVYYYDDDHEMKFVKTRDEELDDNYFDYLWEHADCIHTSNDFVSCAKVAQTTL